ncbi:Retrovirus-related Pol polyprotein like [Argiope bruennichi]|uniref:RNA-directed DNA polymerase n=1 Tax=Argiope bruennichi TaxID=94029 RepID=A0A8T0EXY3_ARGBR|nr:Retrovirus-related Pol polyprotein like [Argiope bruennichi]
MSRYTSIGKVNGVEVRILHDTGATPDLICNKYVKPHMYTNEEVWLRTPLEENLICLPLVEVELDCEMGHIITKAAVIRDFLDQGRYLLGNKTAALFEDLKTKKDAKVHMLIAVETRAQKKLLEIEKDGTQSVEQLDEKLNEITVERKEKRKRKRFYLWLKNLLYKISLKPLLKYLPKSKELKILIAEAQKKTYKVSKYVLENNMLFYKKTDEIGTERKLLVVPEKFREQLMIMAIKDFPTPTNKTQIRAFLDLAGYYRKYIPEFSVISAPLTNLLKGHCRKSTSGWNSSCRKAFEELKEKLSENPVLYSPNFSKRFIIRCDASNLGIGVVLTQLSDYDEEHLIMYLSKNFYLQSKSTVLQKECTAIIYAVQKLKCYFDGQQKFIIQTDHNPLVWLEKNSGTKPRLLRWALILQSFKF